MDTREQTIRLWLSMWLEQRDLGIADVFAKDAVYTESWGPEYHGSTAIRHWFDEWNTRGTVLTWDIQQFFHSGACTAVVWYFQYAMSGAAPAEFDGVSVVTWTADGKIASLKEYGCSRGVYDPYQNGDPPVFREQPTI